jgi:demethylmenaquinone methyltransferase / 2-methoxy-6-polyprenyl-1,4-benzoquinol methylase
MSAVDTEQQEALAAASGGALKRAYVQRIFSEIAPRYDLLNHLLSFNIDRRWRRRAIADLAWTHDPHGVYVDLCAGTMDVGVELARTSGFRGHVIAADFAEPMLRAGRAKVQSLAVAPVVGDALRLPLAEGAASGAIVAFGIRNLADLDAGLRETLRILRPGARFVILEFSMPRNRLVAAGYRFYFHHVLPAVGRLVSGHRTAYRYLPASVANFPVEEELARRMSLAGFANVQWRSLSFGIAALHMGERGAQHVVAPAAARAASRAGARAGARAGGPRSVPEGSR